MFICEHSLIIVTIYSKHRMLIQFVQINWSIFLLDSILTNKQVVSSLHLQSLKGSVENHKI